MNKGISWLLGYFVVTFAMFFIIGSKVVSVDPFFHYHAPKTDVYFYPLNNQRSQNDGITKHFQYEGLITGTSMTENFKTSEAERIFGKKFIKVPYSGGSYKEINDALGVALSHNPELSLIIRGLDMGKFLDDKDNMRYDLGEYPTYLYDDTVFNDVEYVFNRDVIFSRVYPMARDNDKDDFKVGITSFDEYSNWMKSYTFGVNTLFPEGVKDEKSEEPVYLSEEERETVLGNIRQNITSLAEEYPDVDFYYFFTPYSAASWRAWILDGSFYKRMDAERVIIEEILKYPNIKLFSFNNLTNITTDLNNYKDAPHYGQWVNSLMLKYMYEGKCLITEENYETYLDEEIRFYTNFDYLSLNEQEDYENDYYAEALLNEELNGVKPHFVGEDELRQASFDSAKLVKNQHDGAAGFICNGRLDRNADDEIPISEYVFTKGYIGCRISMDMSPYHYLVFYGKKARDGGQPSVYLYNEGRELLMEKTAICSEIDDGWHQYLLDISDIYGNITIIFNGGYTDNTGEADSEFVFSDIRLY